MTTGNGTPKSPILSLDQARSNRIRKGNDFITVQQAYDMVIQECAKVHEHYLAQIPTYTARMIQDALLDLKLVKIVAGDEGVPIIVASTDPRPEMERPVAPVTDAPAEVAQPGEQRPRNAQVDGSSPSLSSDAPPPAAEMATDGGEDDQAENAP